MIQIGLTPMQTKQHTSSVALKVLIFQTPPIIIKKQITHLRQNQLYVYHLSTKKKTQVRWAAIVEWKTQR
jgi:hypothetical protein